jgi:hypothetical protein
VTAAELAALIGLKGMWYAGNGLGIAVRIVDAKSSYGRTRVAITPLHGDGHAWVELGKVTVLA